MKLSTFAASGVLLGALGLAAPVSQADQEWQRAMNNGRSAFLNGDTPDARRWFSAAERRTRSFGATDWRTAGTLNNRGALALANGDLDAALRDLTEARDRYLALFGEDSAPLVRNRIELARVSLGRGDVQAARDEFISAINLAERLDPPQSRGTVAALLGLAGLASTTDERASLLTRAAQTSEGDARAVAEVALARAHFATAEGQFTQAQDYLGAARAALQGLDGSEFALATTQYVEAVLQLQWGKPNEAVALASAAVDAFEGGGIREHPTLVNAILTLSTGLAAQGSLRDADAALQRAAAMASRAVPKGHPLLERTTIASAASALRSANFRTTLDRLKPLLATPSPQAASTTAMRLAATAQMGAGNFAAARETLNTLESLTATLKPGATQSVSLRNLGDLYFKLGDFESSAQRYRESLQSYANDRHPDHARAALGLAQALLAAGDLSSALPAVSDAMTAVISAGAQDGELFAHGLELQARVHLLQGRATDALDTLTRALEIQAAVGGQASLQYANLTLIGAEIALNSGDVASAQQALRKALAGAQKALPSRHPDLARFQIPLIEGYLISGKYREAASTLRTLSTAAGQRRTGQLAAEIKLLAAKLSTAQGRFKEATRHLDRATEAAAPLKANAQAQRLLAATLLARLELWQKTGDGALALNAFGSSPQDPKAKVTWTHALAGFHAARGDYAAAVQSLTDTLTQLGTSVEASTPTDTLLNQRALLELESGNVQAAIATAQQALDTAMQHFGEASDRVTTAKLALASAQLMGGRDEEALSAVTEVVKQISLIHGDESPWLIPALLVRVEVQRSSADTTGALETLSKAQSIREKSQRQEHPDNIALRVSSAHVLLDAGRIADAQSLLNTANGQLRRLAGNNFILGSQIRLGLAQVALERNDLKAADKLLTENEQLIAKLASTHTLRARAVRLRAVHALLSGGEVSGGLKSLAETDADAAILNARAALAKGNMSQAEQAIERARTMVADKFGDRNARMLVLHSLRAELAQARGAPDEAESALLDGIALTESALPRHRANTNLRVQLANVLLDAGRIADAQVVAETARSIAELQSGTEHVDYASALSAAGAVAAAQGRFADAEIQYKAARALNEQTLGADHPNTISTAIALARVTAELGRPGEATNLLQQTRAVAVRAAGSKDGSSATVRAIDSARAWLALENSNLRDARSVFSALLEQTGADANVSARELAITTSAAALAALYAEDLTAAAELAAQAIEAGTRDTGTVKAVAVARMVQSIIALRMGQLEKATQTSNESLEAVSSNLGSVHGAFIDVAQLAGGLWHRNGRTRQAVRYLEQALNSAADALGPEHAKTVNIALDLIRSKLAAGQSDEAEAVFSQVSVSPDASPLLNAKFMRTQALMAAAANDYVSAIELTAGANEITEQVFGLKHPTHALGVVQLSGLQVENGQSSEAEPTLRRALSTLEGALGKSHVSLAPALGYLGSANVDLGRIGGAASYFARQLRTLETAFGESDSRLEPVLVNLAELQVRTNQMDKAIANLRRAVEITRREEQSSSTLRVANASARLAAALVHSGEFAEANELYEQALKVYAGELEADDARVVNTLRSLAALSLLRGNHDAARDLIDRVPASG